MASSNAATILAPAGDSRVAPADAAFAPAFPGPGPAPAAFPSGFGSRPITRPPLLVPKKLPFQLDPVGLDRPRDRVTVGRRQVRLLALTEHDDQGHGAELGERGVADTEGAALAPGRPGF